MWHEKEAKNTNASCSTVARSSFITPVFYLITRAMRLELIPRSDFCKAASTLQSVVGTATAKG